jgi:aminoglycoside phosphotransferase (APT) family kinase protein
MPEWDADIAVDGTIVRAVVAEQFPGRDPSSARLLAEGWDNAVWLLDDEWILRLPRRRVAVQLVDRELAVLPRLAPLLPVAIPTPTLRGRPSAVFPWPFFGCRLLPGREAVEAGLSEGGRLRLGRALGTALRSLHAPDVLDHVDPDRLLPADPLSRADMSLRVPRTRARLTELVERGLWSPPFAAVEAIFDDAMALSPPEPTALVHGDLHFRHVLVDGGRLSGVIDWGDVCRADPAVDLLLYWCFFSPDGRAAFVDAYGDIPSPRLLRARVLSLFLCAVLLAYSHHEGLSLIEAEARAGLERTLVD